MMMMMHCFQVEDLATNSVRPGQPWLDR
jgi:hypothetical protein